MAPEYVAEAGLGVGIYRGTDGFLYCDGVKIDDIRAQAETSPVYIYSKEKIRSNYQAYQEALEGLDSIIGYAVKSNNNLKIVEYLREPTTGRVEERADKCAYRLRVSGLAYGGRHNCLV